MAPGRKTVAFLVAIAAVVAFYAMIPVPPNLSSSDYVSLRVGAFIMDMTSLLRSLPLNADVRWVNFIQRAGGLGIPDDPAVQYTDMRIDSGVKIRLYEPVKTKRGRAGLVYFHGGGWMYGNTKTHHTLTHHLAAELDAVVVSVDYRLAWQRPFPAAINDCTKATTWLMRHAKDYNVDPKRIAIAGDSAGGNLAAAVAARLTFQKEYEALPKLKFQGLIYPALQFLDLNTPSFQQNGDMSCLVITKKSCAYFMSNYLVGSSELMEEMQGNNHTSPEAKATIAKFISHDRIPTEFKVRGYAPPVNEKYGNVNTFERIKSVLLNPDVSPLLRENLQGLPPAYILTAQHDPIRDDGIMYVRRLEEAGMEVTWKHYDNGIHGMFQVFSGPFCLESGKQCVKDFIDYAHKQL